jgi:hypothetical protein
MRRTESLRCGCCSRTVRSTSVCLGDRALALRLLQPGGAPPGGFRGVSRCLSVCLDGRALGARAAAAGACAFAVPCLAPFRPWLAPSNPPTQPRIPTPTCARMADVSLLCAAREAAALKLDKVAHSL